MHRYRVMVIDHVVMLSFDHQLVKELLSGHLFAYGIMLSYHSSIMLLSRCSAYGIIIYLCLLTCSSGDHHHIIKTQSSIIMSSSYGHAL